MSDTPRPGHNHPLDSLCLVIACPRGAYDAGKAAHLDALTAARDECERQLQEWIARTGKAEAHIDALTEACLKCGQPVVGWFRHGQETGHWPNGDPVVTFAGEPSEKPAYQVGSAWPGEPHDA